MNHVRPDFEGDRDIGGAGRAGEARGIVEQGLGRADLNKHRRQAGKSAKRGETRGSRRSMPAGK